MIDPYEAWEPSWPVHIDTGQSILSIVTDDVPDDIPWSRPFLGFARGLEE